MAFYIETSTGQKITWNIPARLKLSIAEIRTIDLFQADGDELELIRCRFDILPMNKGSICQWRGAMGRFIYKNL